MNQQIRPGFILDGFCQGHFGRDSYGPRTLIAIGYDWAIFDPDSDHYELLATPGKSITRLIAELSADTNPDNL